MKKYDIVIVGGGLVGAALACALQNFSYKIALIDANKNGAADPRLFALNHNSICLFKNLKIWQLLENVATAIKQVHVSNKGQFGVTHLNADELNLDALGYVIPAKDINTALYKKLSELNIDLYQPARLISLTQNGDEAVLEIENGANKITLTTNLVVGADGTHSTVRELLNLETEITYYQQKAIVTIIDLQRQHKNIAYERFLKSGAIAMLPLTGQRAAMIWTDNEKTIDALMELSDELFLQNLQTAFGYRLGRFQKINQRHVFPLIMQIVKQPIKDNAILLGNAAHTIHPIAAQGLNIALYEIAEFVEAILDANKKEWLSALQTISNKIQSNLNFSHRLTQVFSNDFFLVRAGRQISMLSLDIGSPIKNYFSKRIMSLHANLPRLLVEEGFYER